MITDYKEALKKLNHKRATTKSVTLGFEENETNKAIIEDVAVYNKLHELEDIEEELGINLITFLKAILQIFVWVKYKNKIVQAGFCLNQNDSGYYFWVEDTPYFIKDYGKTWALTKEELL